MLVNGLRLKVGLVGILWLEAFDRKLSSSSQSLADFDPSDEDNSSKKYRSEFRSLIARWFELFAWTAMSMIDTMRSTESYTLLW